MVLLNLYPWRFDWVKRKTRQFFICLSILAIAVVVASFLFLTSEQNKVTALERSNTQLKQYVDQQRHNMLLVKKRIAHAVLLKQRERWLNQEEALFQVQRDFILGLSQRLPVGVVLTRVEYDRDVWVLYGTVRPSHLIATLLKKLASSKGVGSVHLDSVEAGEGAAQSNKSFKVEGHWLPVEEKEYA